MMMAKYTLFSYIYSFHKPYFYPHHHNYPDIFGYKSKKVKGTSCIAANITYFYSYSWLNISHTMETLVKRSIIDIYLCVMIDMYA